MLKRKHSEAQREAWKAYKAKWKKANPEKVARDRQRYRVKRKYGITLEAYEQLMQRDRCDICNKELHRTDGTEFLQRKCLDHCHETNRIRGVLCASCNLGLGNFFDSPQLLREAADYLEKAA